MIFCLGSEIKGSDPMKPKYPNKRKRKGFWKTYESAGIKDFRKVWNATRELAKEVGAPFKFSSRGRKPNLLPEEIVCMAVMYEYFDNDFRKVEQQVKLLSKKELDHSNCVRWFGRLTLDYINMLVYKVHKKITNVSNAGDYIADSTTLTCDTLIPVLKAGKTDFEHETWKFHALSQYIFTIGLISIVSVFPSRGTANDSPQLRNHLLTAKVCRGKKLHADKGYFGKKNLRKCVEAGLIPNIAPKEWQYTDGYLRRYVRSVYDNKSRKKNRGLIEGIFGGIETETHAKIRCRTPHHRDICTALIGLKHNLRTLFRAKVLNLLLHFAPTPMTAKLI